MDSFNQTSKMDWINLDSIMASLDIRALEVIQKPPEERTEKDTDLLVPWLKRKTRVVQTLETEALAQIVKYCEYMKAEKDEVIIRQGELGNTLYIILSGTVSVYINTSKIADDGTPLLETPKDDTRKVAAPATTDTKDTRQEALPVDEDNDIKIKPEDSQAQTSKPRTEERLQASPGDDTESSYSDTDSHRKAFKSRDKNKFGKFIDKIEAGKCFGEIALISEKNIRNATIISDGPTDLMLIRKELYDKTLKDYQKREFAERRQFVRRHPLFKNWAKHLQRLLEMSLVKEIYTFGSQMVRQGEPWNGLIFILKGRARLLVEPARHKQQYKDLAPFPTENDIYAIEFNRPQKKPPEHPEEVLRWEHIQVRRTEGYAAAERRRLNREVPLCIVEQGEILGDIEYVFNLQTHSASAVSMSPTEAFVLTKKNIERLINKKTPSTCSVLRMEVETKLRNRLSSKQGAEIFLYRHLFFKLTEEIKVPPTRRPDFGVGANSKALPDKETLFLHLMHAFMENRAAAVQPYTEGSVFLRERMREKARLREIVRQKQGDKAPRLNRVVRVRRPPSPKPRSIKHLKLALKKQEEGFEATEREYLAKEYRDLEQEVMRQFYRSALSGLSETGDVDDGLRIICERLKKAGSSMRPPLPALRTAQSLPDLTMSKVTSADTLLSQRAEPDHTFITRLDGMVESRGGKGVDDKAQVNGASPPPEPDGGEADDDGDSPVKKPAEESQQPEELVLDDGQVLPMAVSSPKQIVITPPLNAASEVVVAKEAVRLTARSGHSSSDISDDLLTQEARWRLEQLQLSIRNNVKLAPEDPNYRDWETSDKSLQYLEERVKNFKINREPTFVRLPPLQRFQAGDSQTQPRPGAKVLVQRKPCKVMTKSLALSNHSHVSHHVVESIQNYDKLKYHKILSHFALDDVREKWLEEHRKKQRKRLGVQSEKNS